jgi:hypothetical protein
MTVRAWNVALVALGLAVLGVWASAQAPQQTPVIISGTDIGFQVESQRGGIPVGRLVVRVDGRWVEAQFAAGVRRLSSN